jgi:transcriptional regulator with XRE-family HTH domain
MSERAAEIIRSARDRSGLTQRELASLVKISPARISDYEAARVDPTLKTLGRIAAAAGLDLDVVLRPRTETTSRRLQLRDLASRSVDRSMTIEGKRVTGARAVADLDMDVLLTRIASRNR